MAPAHQELRSLYQAIHAEKRSFALDLVDGLAEAIMLHLKADFCALFVAADGEALLPISLCHHPDVHPVDVSLLRTGRSGKASPGGTHVPGDEQDESNKGKNDGDEFAKRNGFAASSRYWYNDYRGRQVLVVVYWRDAAGQCDLKPDKYMEVMSRLVVSGLASGDSDNSSDDLAEQLSDLVSMFELNHTEVTFSDMIVRVLGTASRFLSIDAAGLLVRPGRTEPFEVYRVADAGQDDDTIGPEVVKLVTDRFSRLPLPGNAEWIEIMDEYQKKAIIAGLVLEEPSLEYAIVLVRHEADRLDAVTAQLLSLYMHSANAVVTHARSVQKLRRSHRALKKSSDKMAAVEAMAAVSDMTTGVAHDFNNIIGGIVGRVQLMKMKADDDKLLKNLEKIEHLALEGAETVKHIQEFATRTRYKRPEPVDLVEMIRTSITNQQADWYHLADSKQLRIVADLPEEGARVDGNSPDLISALDHLIENAAEHAPEGSDIVVHLEAKTDHLRLSVLDSGPGVSEELRSKIFYPFFSTKPERGAGLGLSIVYGTAVRHGGRVGYEDAPGGGSCFYMELEYPQKEDPSETTSRLELSRGALNILVVDDDRLIREILSDMLTIDGHQTVVCEDGYRALEAMEKQTFDLVITDLGMPGMSGLDLAGTIHKSNPNLPIAMITGWGTQLNHDEIKSKGIRLLLSKPFHLKDIKNIVSSLVTGSKQPA
ncbi:MAG TPA: hybrid sensor histidine kinase/response regulator [candidate division Zixibacteria bacterium]|nr:hybrid sensor histidine kinase/response regulator [candidate division Zixibacteria bacterium]